MFGLDLLGSSPCDCWGLRIHPAPTLGASWFPPPKAHGSQSWRRRKQGPQEKSQLVGHWAPNDYAWLMLKPGGKSSASFFFAITRPVKWSPCIVHFLPHACPARDLLRFSCILVSNIWSNLASLARAKAPLNLDGSLCKCFLEHAANKLLSSTKVTICGSLIWLALVMTDASCWNISLDTGCRSEWVDAESWQTSSYWDALSFSVQNCTPLLCNIS